MANYFEIFFVFEKKNNFAFVLCYMYSYKKTKNTICETGGSVSTRRVTDDLFLKLSYLVFALLADVQYTIGICS